ncbi:MAG: flagellar hook-length control protein FliK [Pseudomonadota bacterium]
MNAGLLGEHLASPRTATKTNQSTALDSSAAPNGGPSDQSGFASYVARDTEPSSTDEQPPARVIEDSTPKAQDALPDTVLPTLGIDPEAVTDTNPTPPSISILADAETSSLPLNTPEASDADIARINLVSDDIAPIATETAPPKAELAVSDPRAAARNESRRDLPLTAEAETINRSEPAPLIKADTAIDVADGADADLAADLNPRSRTDAGRGEIELPRSQAPTTTAEPTPIAASDARQALSADASGLDRVGLGGVPRDVAVVAAEPVANIGATATVSTPTTVPAGLTPTAPSIPLAMPNEITGIILNALNNGIDAQEQLVVQLDPPELGRVMIDFKFDAQGLQQIVVTSENPEALKRLRELHFELTQALREHGLSEQNMSFQQQADSQTQDTWTAAGSEDRGMQFTAAEERRASLSATPTAPNVRSKDRLDLLL